MRVFTQQLFDETIFVSPGTYGTWYTPDGHNDLLGAVDVLEFAAHVTNVAGSSPALTLGVEDSADGRHWRNIVNVMDEPISGNLVRRSAVGLNTVVLSFVRLKVTLTGTSPQCRLKLFGMGRVA